MSLDLFSLAFKNIFLAFLRGVIAPNAPYGSATASWLLFLKCQIFHLHVRDASWPTWSGQVFNDDFVTNVLFRLTVKEFFTNAEITVAPFWLTVGPQISRTSAFAAASMSGMLMLSRSWRPSFISPQNMGNESVSKIVINNTLNLFFKLQSALC